MSEIKRIGIEDDLTQIGDDLILAFSRSLRVPTGRVDDMTPQEREDYELQNSLNAYLMYKQLPGVYDLSAPVTVQQIVDGRFRKKE